MSNTVLYNKYDGLNRLTEQRVTNSTGQLLTDYGYDAVYLGAMNQATSYQPSGTITHNITAFNVAGQPTAENWVVPGIAGGTFGFASTYGETGALESRSYPGDAAGGLGETVSYDYFGRNGRPFSVTSSVGGYEYVRQSGWHASGALRFTDRGPAGSGSTALYDIDFVTNRLTRRWDYETLGAATGLQYSEFEYDLNGNIDQLKRHAWEAECYTYDHLDRLVDAFTSTNNCGSVSAGFDHNYSYDSVGNVTFKTGPGTLTYSGSVNAGPFAVTSTTAGDSFGYDLNANMTSRDIAGEPGQTLSYDVKQRLVSVTTGPTVESYDYDVDGIRVVSDNGVDTTVTLGGLFERTVNNATGIQVEEILYYRGPGGTVAMRVNGDVQHLFSDHLGGVVATWEPSTDTASVQTYFPYGEVRVDGGFDTVLGYTGQRHDAGTGLMYYNPRYYDPYLGRFTQPDTIIPDPSSGQDYNRYSYVSNNPINFNDPSGHDACPAGGGGCGGVRQGDLDGDGIVCGGLSSCESLRTWRPPPEPDPTPFSDAFAGTGAPADVLGALDAMMTASLGDFIGMRNLAQSVGSTFNWTASGTSGACSGPVPSVGQAACLRHDFGYRNWQLLRNEYPGVNASDGETLKLWIDDLLGDDAADLIEGDWFTYVHPYVTATMWAWKESIEPAVNLAGGNAWNSDRPPNPADVGYYQQIQPGPLPSAGARPGLESILCGAAGTCTG